MESQERYEFKAEMNERNLWYFSLHHANRGFLGIFNVLFSLAALYLLITTWNENELPYRILLIVCVLLFTVYQPLQLRLKAKKQASLAVMKEPIYMTFPREGFTVRQLDQEQTLAWNQVVRVEGTKNLMIFYMDRVHAFLLPAEAMGAEREAFTNMVREVLPKAQRKRV